MNLNNFEKPKEEVKNFSYESVLNGDGYKIICDSLETAEKIIEQIMIGFGYDHPFHIQEAKNTIITEEGEYRIDGAFAVKLNKNKMEILLDNRNAKGFKPNQDKIKDVVENLK